MKPIPPPSRFLALAALLAAGCASPRPPDSVKPDPEALEQARRDERQRIMQQYWYEHAVEGPPAPSVGLDAGPVLAYPAGTYGGLLFAPRQALDPSLAEPNR